MIFHNTEEICLGLLECLHLIFLPETLDVKCLLLFKAERDI